MRATRRASQRRAEIIIIAAMLVIAIVFVLPYIWMLLDSFKPMKEIVKGKSFWPEDFTFKNYQTVLTKAPILAWFRNSVITAVTGTVIMLFTSTLAGFVFAKYEFKGKNLIFLFILATMMVPQQATMIPTFLLIKRLSLYDNLASLVLPRMVGGFGIFLCRQFIADIPDDLMDAAQIDGAGDMYIYSRLILPLIMPAISALAIFTFLEKWNDYIGPLLYLSTPTNMTMPLALSFFSTQHNQDIGAVMAAATIIMLPVTAVFLAFQKQFVEGIAITGMK